MNEGTKYQFAPLSPVQASTLLAALDIASKACARLPGTVSRGDAFKQLADYLNATIHIAQE